MAKPRKEREPLPEVKCGDSDCENDLHAYREKRKKRGKDYEGVPCRDCGDDSFNWSEFTKRDLNNISLTFNALKKEKIRNVFWNIEIDTYLRNELFNRGRIELEKDVEFRIEKVIKKCGPELFRDGTQTPLDQYNIIYFAQHATATCCRKCLKIWHNVPYNKELDNNDIKYIKNIIMNYVDEKVPDLIDEK